MKTVLIYICRVLLALTFIFSGFVKSIDPLGTQYKITDYAHAVGIYTLPDWLTLTLSIAIAVIEFTLGVMLLLAIQRRRTSKITVVFLSIMTLISLWLALFNPISDCGCFGDAIKLTNWQTFAKNIILLGAAIFLALNATKQRRLISVTNQWIATNYTIIFIIITAVYSLYTLPMFDFRPYKIGNNIPQLMQMPAGKQPPQYETTFILEKDGQQKEFTLEEYPDSTWTFIDRKTRLIHKGYTPPIHDFSIIDQETDNDITEDILHQTDYTFLLISPHLENASREQFGEIDDIYQFAQRNNYKFICLTASDGKATEQWAEQTGAEYPFANTDETTLKTIIRSNPGLVLLKGGTVLNKWSHNKLPQIKPETPISTAKTILEQQPKGTSAKIFWLFLWFILPLLLLTIADQIWQWTRIFRWKQYKQNHKTTINKKQKTMRKKIVAGNWKMNLNLQEGVQLAKDINEALKSDNPNCGVIICTPFIHLATVAQHIDKEVLQLGAENCADKEKGAYTGEVSAEMVKSTGADYVILGHSERRGYYGETPEILKEKVLLALKNNLKVIFCIGESLEEREANKQNEVVKAELEGSVFNLDEADFRNIIIAYEPIWAIGTGKTATAEQAEEIHSYIRSIIAERYGKAVADETTILYGGSCKASNAPELFSKLDIDGGLIGGASLKVADFKGIIDAWK